MKNRFARRTSKALTRTLAAGVILIGLTAGSIGGYWGVVQYGGNFHTVEEGALYRSAQLSADELQTAIRDHGIERSSICGALIPERPGTTTRSGCRRHPGSRITITAFPRTGW